MNAPVEPCRQPVKDWPCAEPLDALLDGVCELDWSELVDGACELVDGV